MSCDAPIISVRNVNKHFTIYDRPVDWLLRGLTRNDRYGRRVYVLEEVSFDVKRGSALGIIGRNGAGKSTLLQLVCGTLAPSSGKIDVRGRVAALLELGAGFNPEYSGRENIFMNALIMGMQHAEIEKRFDEIVEFSGVGDFIDLPVKTYSSGMFVRLAFSIATSVNPDILVIDEALSVGDGAFARKSFDRIMSLKDGGATILFCSHSMYHVEAICDAALWLDRGRVAKFGLPPEVAREYQASLSGDPGREALHVEVDAGKAVQSQREGVPFLLGVTVDHQGPDAFLPRLVSGESSLHVAVTFTAGACLPPPAVCFGIETVHGTLVSSGGTCIDGVAVVIDESGRGRVDLCFPRLPLMRGNYRISIFLTCERGLHVYDYAQHCATFEVHQENDAQGLVFLSRSWDGGPILTGPEEAKSINADTKTAR